MFPFFQEFNWWFEREEEEIGSCGVVVKRQWFLMEFSRKYKSDSHKRYHYFVMQPEIVDDKVK